MLTIKKCCVKIGVKGGEYMDLTTIGGRVWAVREKFGLSRREFAERLGCQDGEILNVEYNRLKKPEQKESLYRNIAAEFDVSLDWLKTGESCMFGCNSQDEIMLAYGELAARKDPNIDGIIQFLRSRTSDEMDVIINTLKDCLSLIEAAKNAKKED